MSNNIAQIVGAVTPTLIGNTIAAILLGVAITLASDYAERWVFGEPRPCKTCTDTQPKGQYTNPSSYFYHTQQ